jgi:hypothetical protein
LFFVFIFGLSLLFARSIAASAAAECGIMPVDEPTHLMGRPLVDDHFIYCNITHTRTINEGCRPKWGELKWKKCSGGTRYSVPH